MNKNKDLLWCFIPSLIVLSLFGILYNTVFNFKLLLNNEFIILPLVCIIIPILIFVFGWIILLKELTVK